MRVRSFIPGFIVFTAVAASIAGCAYAKKEVVVIPCVIPTAVSYAKDVQPIIASFCYDCHSAGSSSAGFTFDSYSSLRVYAQSGQLYGAISHASGYRPMPDNGGKLSDCNISLIKRWIDNGTPQ